MKQYKTVAGPAALRVGVNGDYATAVNQYAAIIDREAAGGWELVMIQEIPVTRDVGCLQALMGQQAQTMSVNMLVFAKEV